MVYPCIKCGTYYDTLRGAKECATTCEIVSCPVCAQPCARREIIDAGQCALCEHVADDVRGEPHGMEY